MKPDIRTPIDRLSEIFGGQAALASAAGVVKSAVTAWRKRNGGRIPPRYNTSILSAGTLAGISSSRIRRHLDANVCPLCGSRGVHVHAQSVRRLVETMGRTNGTKNNA